MCKYCDYVFDPEENSANDLLTSELKINGVEGFGEIGVYINHNYRNHVTPDRDAYMKLYIRPKHDDYFTQCKLKINYCPVCGKDLRELPPIED